MNLYCVCYLHVANFLELLVVIQFFSDFRDIILKPKETESICWKCRTCSLSLPHMHAHKVVLSSSCDYLRALFQSGMRERYIH